MKSSEYGAGKVKLELHYSKKQEKLTVMVRHVKDLVSTPCQGDIRKLLC